jgi:hypothetical protein
LADIGGPNRRPAQMGKDQLAHPTPLGLSGNVDHRGMTANPASEANASNSPRRRT